MKPQLRAFLLGGLLPIAAYTAVEELYGELPGLIFGMVIGVGEILWEYRRDGKVQAMTWAGNALVLGLGGISLVTKQGIWFKLQPSILEGALTLALWGSALIGKPLMAVMVERQWKAMASGQPDAPPPIPPEFQARMRGAFGGMTWRLGAFFGLHAGLAAWAALYWSTAAWAALKGIGFTLSLVLYMVVEGLVLRYRFGHPRRTSGPV